MTRRPFGRPARRPVRASAAAGLAAAAAAVVLAGCGASHGAPAPSSGAGGKDAGGCGDAVLDLAAAPPGGVCVGVGRTLTVHLTPGKGEARASGAALTRVGEDVFRGAAAGTAELSGSWTCPPPKPGEARCLMIGTWRVPVEVR